MQYPVNPARYPGSTTAAERAEVDRKNFADNPDLLLETLAELGAESVRIGSFVVI